MNRTGKSANVLVRALSVGIVCAGALWLASAPASALTVSVGGTSVGGTTPVVGPISLPLPTTSVSIGADGPVSVGIQAPGSTGLSVQAGPTGLSAKATVANTPLVDASVGSPDLANPTAPVAAIAPVSVSVPGITPTVGAPIASATPTNARPSSGADAHPNDGGAQAPGTRLTNLAFGTARDISAVRHAGHASTANVTGSIASSPGSDVLSSLPEIGARLMLWVLLAGVVVALRLFFGSPTSKAVTSKVRRAS